MVEAIRGDITQQPVDLLGTDPGAFEHLEPLPGGRDVLGDRGDVHRRHDAPEHLFEPRAALRVPQELVRGAVAVVGVLSGIWLLARL